MPHIVRCSLILISGLTFVYSLAAAHGEDRRIPERLQLTVEKPGLSSLELETEVALPLESAVKPLQEIAAYETELRDGECRLVVTLNEDASFEKVLLRLQTAIGALTAFDLKPDDMIFEQVYPERNAVWVVCKSSQPEQLSAIESANNLKSKLERIPHVGKVTAVGIPRRVIEVLVDTNRSAAYLLPAQSIYETIKKDVAQGRPGLTPERPVNRLPVSLNALSESLPELTLKQVNGESVRLQDVAQVRVSVLYLSEARLDRDRVFAFEVRPDGSDSDTLGADIQKNQADWINDLNRAGEGIELAVFKPELRVELVLPPGIKRDQLDRIAEVARLHVRERLENSVDMLSVRTGPDSNLLQFYLQRSQPGDSNEISSPAVREALADIPGIFVQITDLRKKTDDSIEFRILGPDLDVLQNAARQASAELNQLDGVAEVRTDTETAQPEVFIEVRREKAAKLGVKIDDIATSTRLMMSPDGPEDLLEAGVCLRFPEENLKASRMGKMLIPAEKQQLIPLSAVADIQMRQKPPVIRRRYGSRMVSLTIHPASSAERQHLQQEVRTIGDNLRARLPGEPYRIEVE